MKNTYYVSLINEQGCTFDNGTFTSIKAAKKWAAGRGSDYHTEIKVNGEEYPSICYKNR